MSTIRLHSLRQFGAIQFSGDDAEVFLHGQLSCDVAGLALHRSTYGSYCTPKGRILATFLLWRAKSGYFMQLPAELSAAIHRRISMHILRSRVKALNLGDALACLGLDGEGAGALLERTFGAAPPATLHDVVELPEASIIRLPQERFEIVAQSGKRDTIRQAFVGHAAEAGAGQWEFLDIEAGIPVITAATQEEFVPQMVNLDLIGGVSFAKGCYPGQEIVARMHYLGRLKQRMYRVHVASARAPQAGDRLYGAGFGDQSCGMIVSAVPASEEGYSALAVVQIDQARDDNLHLHAIDGPPLRILDLPYVVTNQ